ncbi:MAG TPA: glycosyltransferase family 2 protein [Atribacteraceae bacterium]|nr:glycosyltransferase family 2 protein [Atribacteraceae bacterium]
MADSIVYSVVVPVYNEEAVIEETHRRLRKVMAQTGESYELIFVDDGSSDRSREIIAGLCRQHSDTRLIGFSRNFGHEAATTAGLDHARGKAVVIIDADLQDPPEVILLMIERWRLGYQVVYGKRWERKGESFFKRMTASLFYRLLNRLTSITIPMDTGDFRLIDERVCRAMRKLREKSRFIRGLVSWIGFRTTAVEYVRDKRWAGDTKYSFGKLLALAWDAVAAFSNKPLKLATYVGFCLSLMSFIYLIIVVIRRVGDPGAVPGWASIVVINLFFNGVILIILGIIGEYLGRIYEETKNRPLYIVDVTEGIHHEQPAQETSL